MDFPRADVLFTGSLCGRRPPISAGSRPGDTWEPETVVLRCLRVRIEHDEGEESEASSAEFTADNPAGFTEGELLFKVRNAFAEQLQKQAHYFFEGFSLREEPEDEAPPVY